jgi:hypothetical protein
MQGSWGAAGVKETGVVAFVAIHLMFPPPFFFCICRGMLVWYQTGTPSPS